MIYQLEKDQISGLIYDFLKHGIISDYDGLLGLDFFENTEFTINMKNQTIEVKPA